MLENAKCLQLLLKYLQCFVPVEDYRSDKGFVHDAFRLWSMFFKPRLLLEPVEPVSIDNTSSNFTAIVDVCCNAISLKRIDSNLDQFCFVFESS